MVPYIVSSPDIKDETRPKSTQKEEETHPFTKKLL